MINVRILVALCVAFVAYLALLVYLYWPLIRLVVNSHGGPR